MRDREGKRYKTYRRRGCETERGNDTKLIEGGDARQRGNTMQNTNEVGMQATGLDRKR